MIHVVICQQFGVQVVNNFVCQIQDKLSLDKGNRMHCMLQIHIPLYEGLCFIFHNQSFSTLRKQTQKCRQHVLSKTSQTMARKILTYRLHELNIFNSYYYALPTVRLCSIRLIIFTQVKLQSLNRKLMSSAGMSLRTPAAAHLDLMRLLQEPCW